MNVSRRHPPVSSILIVLSLLFLTAACSSLGGGQSSAPPNPVGQSGSYSSGGSAAQSPPSPPPPSSHPPSSPSSSSYSAPAGPRPLFYDFQDVPIPHELSLVEDESYVFQSGPMKVGLLTFRGRVDLASLINFFQMALPREGWKAKGGFRYRRSVLIFDKADKTCVINLYDKMYYTYAEVYVAPAGSGPL